MYFRSALLIFFSLLSSLPALAQDNKYYSGFDSFKQYSEAVVFNKMLNNLKKMDKPTLLFKSKNLCEKGSHSFASLLELSSDIIYKRANTIAKKIKHCPQSCEAKINKAEYCGYHSQRTIESRILSYWGSSFFEAEYLIEQAVQQQRLPEEQLFMGSSLVINESLDLLRIGLKALKAHISPDALLKQNPRWSLAKTELQRLANTIELLSLLKVIQGDTNELINSLIASHETLGKLNTELHQELTRARVSPLSVIEMWETRILQSASQLIWAQQVFANSASKARNRANLQINTEANSNPHPMKGTHWQQTATCFKQLSLNSDTAIGGIQMELEILQSCRDFNACNNTIYPFKPVTIERYSACIEKSLKDVFAITHSMCNAK